MLINIFLDHSFLNWKKDYLFFLVTIMIFHLRECVRAKPTAVKHLTNSLTLF